MRRLRCSALGAAAVWAAVSAAVSGAAAAGPFDGVYVVHRDSGAPDRSGCLSVDILIAGDRVVYYDLACTLTNPVQIRDMEGVLYDGQCALDGTPKQGRVLIRRMASGDVALVTPFMDVRLAACEVAG